MTKGFQSAVVPMDFNRDGRMDFLSFYQDGRHADKWKVSTHLNTSKNAAYLWGTDQKDNLKGDAGNNKLIGGAGSDILTGAKGKDAFVFDSPLTRNVDRITDFKVTDDSIWLDNAVFRDIGWGTPAHPQKMGADLFRLIGEDNDAKIIYDNAGGGLYYDADGKGDGGMVRFAQVAKNLAMTAADFYVI
jgi:Ca2+-binding RTX toxin-like protein